MYACWDWQVKQRLLLQDYTDRLTIVMDLESQIAKSAEWMTGAMPLLNGIRFETTNRRRVAVALLHLSVEHQMGIHVLVDNGVIGSAFALIRPQFETFVRGAWYHRCASDKEVSAFIQGAEPQPISQLISALENLEAFDEKLLSSVKDSAWSNLCDFTHGGTTQVKARVTADEIGSNYEHEHISGILQSSTALSLLASVEIASGIEDSGLAVKLKTLHTRLYE